MGTTIYISEETKALLDKLKTGSYDSVIRKLVNMNNPNQVYPREIKNLTITVPASTKITREENKIILDEDVRITRVYVYFPPGCQYLVEITLGAGKNEFAPKIVSGDGKSVSIEPNIFVPAKTPIWAEITNYDAINPHTPTVEVEVEKIREVEVT